MDEPENSVKSLRTYQAGVIFKDTLGRETPIFSSKSGIVNSTLNESISVNKLKFALQGDPPEWATHFKYFIKDSTNEYYNLAADRLYQTEDKLATWISFPSSDRNKVDEDTYLIAKKYHDKDLAVTDNDNKYKIIDISSEAPVEISKEKAEIAETKIHFDTNFGDGSSQTIKNVGSTSDSGSESPIFSANAGAVALTTCPSQHNIRVKRIRTRPQMMFIFAFLINSERGHLARLRALGG